MADKTISALTAASTPLAGTEVLPIVQSGSTVKVSVADLTLGRAISATQATLTTGNLIIGTSGQGIDFSASPHTGGMTSELLADYEEGTWTPNQGPGLTVVGTFSSNGTYTKIGRQVTINGNLFATTSLSCFAFGQLCTNLPYASSSGFLGALFGGSPTVSNTSTCSGALLFATEAISAGGQISFTITYFV